jgi:hypothetical protein
MIGVRREPEYVWLAIVGKVDLRALKIFGIFPTTGF